MTVDPQAALREIRKITNELLTDGLHDTSKYIDLTWRSQQADRLAELVESLDEWLTKGGFLPDDWNFVPFTPEIEIVD